MPNPVTKAPNAGTTTPVTLGSFEPGAIAVVIGASGGIGRAFVQHLTNANHFSQIISLSRSSTPPLDLSDETSIENCAVRLAGAKCDIRLIIDATGFLHDDTFQPEKSWRQIDPAHMAKNFAINAIGPALLMKHFLPLLPKTGKSTFVTLSARVGSIGDNHIGGWYGYRAAKAALNQIVKTMSVELARKRRDAICIALHPGTVDTGLSAPFAKSGLPVQTAPQATTNMLRMIDQLDTGHTGGFYAYDGRKIEY
ncbi:SDR family oxidoreductase [Thalassospira marina]|uniref:C-factor n=1 Tax=Thalassospira marina TaxID=2048283 RepID=A0A2N3L010_9PROT|nr:SDR family oxidoreductase [Thalassospira marina]PKR56159.1 C-factor [Thalassospira marina]